MDVKEAVKRAKAYVADIFAEESLSNLGLEEVEYEDASGTWNITIGFSRPWNNNRNPLGSFSILGGEADLRRSYKVVRIRGSDSQVLSLEERQLA